MSRSKKSAKCPRCQTSKWNESVFECKCKRCGGEWKSRSERPVRCPKCKSAKWNEEIEKIVCPKCGGVRIKKSNSRSALCPRCDVNVRVDKCRLCGASWKSSRKNIVTKCPSCGSEKWNEEKTAPVKAVPESYGNDPRRLSKMLDVSLIDAEIFIANSRGESPVSLSFGLDIPFAEIIGSIQLIRSRL